MYKYDGSTVPQYTNLMNPTLQAIKELGGSASINEIYLKVIDIMQLDDSILDISHNEKGNQSEVEYRLAWARTYLKKYGLIDNSSRGVWSLIKFDYNKVRPADVVKKVKNLNQVEKEITTNNTQDGIDEEIEKEIAWEDKLRQKLLSLQPDAFERLTQRILRESGFVQVEVTGKTGDGGIDGKGIVKLNGIMSFHMMFQCKRYKDKNSISSNQIRDFRGALQGRADKGLFITTSNFTRDAIKEATRDGATPIDLVDGDSLIDMLRNLSLGVKEIIKRDYEIDFKWFDEL